MNKLRGCLKSLTIWFNGVLASLVVVWPDIQSAFASTDLAPYVGGVAARWVMLGALVINILIRFRTKKPLEEK